MASKKKSKRLKLDTEAYVKASRRGEYEAIMENENGFISAHKVHKTKKPYSRKRKYKEDYS